MKVLLVASTQTTLKNDQAPPKVGRESMEATGKLMKFDEPEGTSSPISANGERSGQFQSLVRSTI